jgi:Holliday junction resolvase RusA-like endonuclease
MIKTIMIPGIPDVKMRPRFTKNGHSYDPNAQQKEASIQKAKISGSPEIFTGALEVNFRFVFPRPKNHFRTGKNAGLLKADVPVFCTNNKDFDNLEKFYSDSFNCIAYADDRQIVKSHSSKEWAGENEMPHVFISIMTLEDK